MSRRIVYQVNCPECGRRIRAPSEELRRERVLRHVRNCNAFKKAGVVAPPSAVAPTEQEPAP